MFYLASGYEERVGEVFESRVTQLNAWKDVQVQGQHVRASLAHGWTCTGVHRPGRELKRMVEHAGRRWHRQACADERGQARWSSTDVRTCMRMHAGDGRHQAPGRTASDECTVHPRARSSPEKMKST
ncbi:hypothetical protein CDL15_Pgr008322 [Punica granatum]|uniref:Uncharacterized protein n=1 Tax=Punica granatum TaxID=22663 RepID=A0A218XT97_PUNGR|nr:hypothetical protein CDL15_Pgr008322 [Punica granatum]